MKNFRNMMTIMLSIALIFRLGLTSEAVNLGSIYNWYANEGGYTTKVNYYPYSVLNGGTTCNWTYKCSSTIIGSYETKVMSAAYSAASAWSSTSSLGFTLTKVNSNTTPTILVFISDLDGIESTYNYIYQDIIDDPSALAYTYVSNDGEYSHHVTKGTMEYSVKSMDSAIIFPFTVYTDTSAQNKYNNMVAHEFGHALGWVGHNTSNTCLMRSTAANIYSPDAISFTHLHQIYAYTLMRTDE